MNRRTVTLAGVAVSAAVTVIGVTTRFATPEIDNAPAKVNSVENMTKDLSDAQDRVRDRMRVDGLDHGNAENTERLKAVVPKPPRFPR